MNNKNKGLIITLIILLIIGLSGYLIYDKVLSNNKNYQHTTLDFRGCDIETSKTCTKKSGDINISFIEESEMEITVKINNKTVLSKELFTPNKVDILDNNVIFATSGTDILSSTLYAFDKDGNKILEVRNLDDNYDLMGIEGIDDEGLYKIKDNSILLNGSRINHGPSIIINDDLVDICPNKDKYKNEIVYGEYKIEYLGNNKFSKIKTIKTTKLSETDILDHCN